MRLNQRAAAAAILLGLVVAAAPARAISASTLDTFEAGVNGWHVGGSHPSPPEVASGGPGGSDDGYLLLTAVGGGGAGGRLAVIAGTGWNGDYTAAGVTSIVMDALNQGDSALQLRLFFDSAAGTALSTLALNLPVSATWTHLVFAIAPANLTGVNPAATLHGVTEMRLFHNPNPVYPPSPVVALLGIDNVAAVAAAVPEPGAAWLWAAGAGALLCAAQRRRRAGLSTQG